MVGAAGSPPWWVSGILRSGRPTKPRPPGRADDGPGAATRGGCHRRDPAPARPLPSLARPGRPAAAPSTLPDPRQCHARSSQTILGDAGRKVGDRHAAWIRPGRVGGKGAQPPAYLARSEQANHVWRQQFIHTYLERALPQLGITIPAATLLRFWTMLAHYHGGTWNAGPGTPPRPHARSV